MVCKTISRHTPGAAEAVTKACGQLPHQRSCDPQEDPTSPELGVTACTGRKIHCNCTWSKPADWKKVPATWLCSSNHDRSPWLVKLSNCKVNEVEMRVRCRRLNVRITPQRVLPPLIAACVNEVTKGLLGLWPTRHCCCKKCTVLFCRLIKTKLPEKEEHVVSKN